MTLPVLKLKRGEDRRLRAGHLWIFSNEVDTQATPLTQFEPGAAVQVHSDRDQFLGFAYVNPRTLIAAAPVGSRYAIQLLEPVADHVVCPLVPDDLMAVGAYYADFGETSDSTVRDLLAETFQTGEMI